MTDFPNATPECLRWAEGLIKQLPLSHEGRNSWLMNFGHGQETDDLRLLWEGRTGQAYPVNAPLPGAAVNAYGASDAEPVAWQIRPRGADKWTNQTAPWPVNDEFDESRPLYATPRAASDARVRELREVVMGHLEDYEFRGDVDHVPTEGERTMLEDFGWGLVEALRHAGLLNALATPAAQAPGSGEG